MQKIYVAGYPFGKGLSDDLKINEGKISSLKGFENNSNEITVDLAINPGNSGGPIVNENDLIESLKSNQIAGAGIDVYDHEPLPENHKLRFLPNALLLPHLGYVTAENYSIFYSQMIENLEACVNNKPIRVIK